MAHKMIPPCGRIWVMMSQYVLRKLKLLKKCGISRNPELYIEINERERTREREREKERHFNIMKVWIL